MPIATVNEKALYPTPLLFRYGEPSMPQAVDLIWLTRGLRSVAALLRKDPKFMETSMSELLGLDMNGNELGESEVDNKIPVNIPYLGCSPNATEEVVLRNSSVLSMTDVEALRQAIKKKAATISSKEHSTVSTTDSATKPDDGSCVLM